MNINTRNFIRYSACLLCFLLHFCNAWNLRCFAKTAGLFPGGFSGLSLLLQQIGLDFIHVSIPFSVFNIGLNLVPTYIAYKFIGKKFTLYSNYCYCTARVFLSDMLPAYVVYKGCAAISVFGGLTMGLPSVCV